MSLAETPLRLPEQTQHLAHGEVFIVGAGPGDAELLTVRALRLIQQAEVIIYDRLVGPEIIALFNPDAEQIFVGKSRDNHHRSQQQINQLLVEHAKAGKQVVRLKGGDPFVFGRGGEEIEALAAADIPYQVVAGITAAIGCAANVGIPLTHRDHAHACTFLTGQFHSDEADIDWKALIQMGQTLVFYMGVYNLEKITSTLLENGMNGEMPAALIQEGTLPQQQVVVSTVAMLAEQVCTKELKPGVVIVGDTVRFADYLRVQ